MSMNQKLSREEINGAIAMLQHIYERLQQQGLDVPIVNADLPDNERLQALVDAIHKAVCSGKVTTKPAQQQKPVAGQDKSADMIAAKVIEYIKQLDLTNARQN